MKKRDEYILAGVVIVVVLLFVWLWGSGGNYEVPGSNNTTSTKSTGSKTTTSSALKTTPKVESFTNLLPVVGNYECDYEETTPSTRSTNAVYLSGGKMRGEFRSRNAQGITTNSIFVYDGVSIYSWVEGKTTGTITHPKSLADFPQIIPKDILTGVSLGSGLNNASWQCHPWSVVPSLLVKPSYIQV